MKPSKILLIALAALPACLQAQNTGPNLLWSDEFNLPLGSAPDSTKWTYDLGGGGWGNAELETYTSSTSNASVVSDPDATDGKALAITAINPSSGQYTSARIKTQGLFSVTYGLIEARVKVPVGTGYWPAFWMLGNNIGTVGWPQCGEIDIMENLGSNPGKIYGTLHGPGYSGSKGISATYVLPNGGSFNAAYHLFAVQWSPNQIQWSVDGNVYQTLTPASLPQGTQWVCNAPFFIILNLAVGGNFPGNPTGSTQFPQSYLVDYVRVYNLAPSAPATFAAYATVTGAVGLSWTAPTATGGNAITGYQLVRATDGGFTQNVTTFALGASTSYVDSSVTAGTTYYYHVSTVTSGGVSTPGASVSVQPAVTAGSGAPSQFVDIATRCFVGTGANVGIAGVVVRGTSPVTILFRGGGPALAGFGVGGNLPDPQINLYDVKGNLLATNAGWGNNANASAISSAAAGAGAFAYAAGSADSALLITLPPGQYTAEVLGASGDTGVALIEAYLIGP